MKVVAAVVIVEQRSHVRQEQCGSLQFFLVLDVGQVHLLHHGVELFRMHDGLANPEPHLLLDRLQLSVEGVVAGGNFLSHDDLAGLGLVIGRVVVDGLLEESHILNPILESDRHYFHNQEFVGVRLG